MSTCKIRILLPSYVLRRAQLFCLKMGPSEGLILTSLNTLLLCIEHSMPLVLPLEGRDNSTIPIKKYAENKATRF